MFRISKLTDYALVLLASFGPAGEERTARDLAGESRVPLPTVAKILKALSRAGLLASRRGANGGYALARRPDQISVAEVVGIIDGPIAITDCSGEPAGRCTLEAGCPVRSNWRRINVAVSHALQQLTLSDLVEQATAAAASCDSPESVHDERPPLRLVGMAGAEARR